jgi:hypothetical protein
LHAVRERFPSSRRYSAAWAGKKGSDVADEMHAETAETYAKRAAEMKEQAQRAETVVLQAIYSSIADNWDRLAAQMQASDRARLDSIRSAPE